MENNNCYSFNKIIYNEGLLDKSVDATYIIHLVNNGRLESINKQLKLYKPTKIVYIMMNKGYKKCNKEDYINTSPKDLVDAFFNVFKHAEKEKYNNILVLEDDFFFNIKIKDKKVLNNINKLLNIKKHTDFSYYLGGLPFLQLPYNFNTNFVFFSGATHSIIYSKKYRLRTLKMNQKYIKDWDEYQILSLNKYNYKIPLCYQLFPNTENSKHWNIIARQAKKFMNLLYLDKKPEPGYTFYYITSTILCFIFIFILLFYMNKYFISHNI